MSAEDLRVFHEEKSDELREARLRGLSLGGIRREIWKAGLKGTGLVSREEAESAS
jgi:hypothetical protein